MSKTRQFTPRNAAVPVPHPDGGVLHLYKLDAIRDEALSEKLEQLKYEHDEDGSVQLDGEGKPVARVWASAEEKELARIDAIRSVIVQRLEGLVDENEQPIDCTPEIITAFLAETSMRLVDQETPRIDWDDEKKTVRIATDANGKPLTYTNAAPAKEKIYVWAVNEARRLAQSGREAEAKNSSSTQSASSAPQAS